MLKPYFKAAKKVKLVETGRYNSQEGLVHFKRMREGGEIENLARVLKSLL